jgi:hypothetical protein
LRFCRSCSQILFEEFRGDLALVGEDGADFVLIGWGMVEVWGPGPLPIPDELLGRVMVKRSNNAVIGEFAQLNMSANGLGTKQHTHESGHVGGLPSSGRSD